MVRILFIIESTLYHLQECLLKRVILCKYTFYNGGDGLAARFLYTAHSHTHVFGFNHNHNTLWLQIFFQCLCDLCSHIFLNLRTSCKNLHGTCELAESCDSSVRDISNMCFAVERKQMVFADRVEGNILFYYNVIIGSLKLFAEMNTGIFIKTAINLFKNQFDTVRSFKKSLEVNYLIYCVKYE